MGLTFFSSPSMSTCLVSQAHRGDNDDASDPPLQPNALNHIWMLT